MDTVRKAWNSVCGSESDSNQDSSFFGDVKSNICKLIKAIKPRITRIHQVTERERKYLPCERPQYPVWRRSLLCFLCFLWPI